MTDIRRPVALIVLDGWGNNPSTRANAVAAAKTPHFDHYRATYPHTELTACGEAVGLLPGQMGDSNVGHLNLGAGRVVYQTLVRIWKSIQDESFFTLPAWTDAIARVRQSGGALHIMGLVSDGGVHSHLDHLLALVNLVRRADLQKVYIHAFLDGRDVPPTSAPGYIEALEQKLKEAGVGRIATVSGRYYAMDRDKRWERTQLAFDALAGGHGIKAESALAAVTDAHARGETDEFVKPTVVGEPVPMQPGDVGLFFNFRPDRARQITMALHDPNFTGFARPESFVPLYMVGMTQYDQNFDLPVAFAPEFVNNPLGEVVARAGLRQLRIAETEKYPHVTYFFNGGEEHQFPGEERVMVPSPKVATYDLQPEMSAYGITAEAVKWIAEDRLDFMVLNFANADMVGHTGFLDAAVKAVEAVDDCLGQVVEALRREGGAALILADHGNADQMLDYDTEQPHTNHTLHPVPCILVDDTRTGVCLKSGGVLANVAPTLLQVLGLAKPAEMEADTLIEG